MTRKICSLINCDVATDTVLCVSHTRRATKYNLSAERLIELFAQYAGRCHVCRIKAVREIDHNHKCCDGAFSCGACVRGALCHGCNSLISNSKEDTAALRSHAAERPLTRTQLLAAAHFIELFTNPTTGAPRKTRRELAA